MVLFNLKKYKSEFTSKLQNFNASASKLHQNALNYFEEIILFQ